MDFGKWGKLIEVFLTKNSEINLSAIRDAQWVYVKHILDSLELLKISPFIAWQRVCDLGTGGGFPLLPLAIENPDVRFVGIDARKKKIDAIVSIVESLKLKVTSDGFLENVDLVWSRVEEYKGLKFDVVMARAVAHVDILIPWMVSIVKKWGRLVLYKEYKEEEKELLLKLSQKYKLSIQKEHRYVLEGTNTRVIYLISA